MFFFVDFGTMNLEGSGKLSTSTGAGAGGNGIHSPGNIHDALLDRMAEW